MMLSENELGVLTIKRTQFLYTAQNVMERAFDAMLPTEKRRTECRYIVVIASERRTVTDHKVYADSSNIMGTVVVMILPRDDTNYPIPANGTFLMGILWMPSDALQPKLSRRY